MYEKDGFVFKSRAEYVKYLVGTMMLLIVTVTFYAFVFHTLLQYEHLRHGVAKSASEKRC